jgi:hypothetical protein
MALYAIGANVMEKSSTTSKDRMYIIDATWAPTVNRLMIACPCGRIVRHMANQWRVVCVCGRSESLREIRERPLGKER